MSAVTTIVEYLNTLNLAKGLDILSDQGGPTGWLKETSPDPGGTPSLQDVAWAIEVREAIRDLVSGNAGGIPSLGSLEILNRAARMVFLGVGFDRSGARASAPSAAGLHGVVARLLVAVHTAMADESWSRIKVCRNPDCRWAFYDRSRNHSGVWCAMAECGNKMKARRFRRRSRQEPGGGSPTSGRQ